MSMSEILIHSNRLNLRLNYNDYGLLIGNYYVIMGMSEG